MMSCATENRLTNVTPDDLRKTAEVAVREVISQYSQKWGNLTVLANESGVSETTLSLFKNDVNRGMTLYTAEKILAVMGKHIEVVDD